MKITTAKPITQETLARLESASIAVERRRSTTGAAMHHELKRMAMERQELFPEPEGPIQAAAWPGASPGMNWQYILHRTAEPIFTEGEREESRYWMQAQAIVGEAREDHAWTLVQYLSRLMLAEVRLHQTHGEIHNPYLEGILKSLANMEQPELPQRLKGYPPK